MKASEAAKLLGVTPKTFRNWDRSGKLKPVRNPANGYQLYSHEDTAAYLSQLDRNTDRYDSAGGACVSEVR